MRLEEDTVTNVVPPLSALPYCSEIFFGHKYPSTTISDRGTEGERDTFTADFDNDYLVTLSL
jgi:hypothetical protein